MAVSKYFIALLISSHTKIHHNTKPLKIIF